MTKGKLINSPLKNSPTVQSEDSVNEVIDQKFYSPLSVTGYLTPLQRKKLREKRKSFPDDLNFPKGEKVKKAIKRKRDNSLVGDSNKERIKRLKTKDIHLVQCTVAKILSTKHENDIKTKKFFKGSLSDRLSKANFKISLNVKNFSLGIDKEVKETTRIRESSSFEEASTTCSSKVCDSDENTKELESQCSAKNVFNQNPNISKEQTNSIEQNTDIEQISLQEEENIFKFDWPSDDELLKRQEKARLQLREKNVLKEISNHHESESVKNDKDQIIKDNQAKYYPIFHIAIKKKFSDNLKRNQKTTNRRLKDYSKGGEQIIIDAGQKKIGAKTCPTCNMLYTVHHEEDERLHLNYHNMYLVNLKFLGWKEENMIGEYSDGRVIMIRNTDKSFMLKKVEDILQVANRDLGFPSSALPEKSDLVFLLFISKTKQVAGLIVAEPITKAFRVLLRDDKSTPEDTFVKKVWRIGNWYSSSEADPAVCGVNRIWVAHTFRRQKVASRMIDCLRCHFIHGHVVGIRELAFTDPSPDGREFAAAYTGTDHFLVYK